MLAAEIAAEFPDRHSALLIKAIDEAIDAGRGLLEATDVIEPNPIDLNATTGETNRLNCEIEGALVYR
ncbi:MAG: hypothetical protein AAGA65_31455, partial [Actinomycetota bacterium]